MNTIDATAASPRAGVSASFLGLLAGTLGLAVFSSLTVALLAASASEASSGGVADFALMALLCSGCLYAGSAVGRFGRDASAADAAIAFVASAAAFVSGASAGLVIGGGPALEAVEPTIAMSELLRLGATMVASGFIAMVVGGLVTARGQRAEVAEETFIYLDEFDNDTIDLRDPIDLQEDSALPTAKR